MKYTILFSKDKQDTQLIDREVGSIDELFFIKYRIKKEENSKYQ
jgi:hypothetical protein